MKFLTTLAVALIAMAAVSIDHGVYANDNGSTIVGNETVAAGAVRPFDGQTTGNNSQVSGTVVVRVAPQQNASEVNVGAKGKPATGRGALSGLPAATAGSSSEGSQTGLPHIEHRQPVVVLTTSDTDQSAPIPPMTIAMICLGTVGAALLTYSIAFLVAHKRAELEDIHHPKSPTAPGSVKAMVTPLTDVECHAMAKTPRQSPSGPSASTRPMPDSKVFYASMVTPASKVCRPESQVCYV